MDALKISKETREKELTDYIGKATADREQIIHSYTSYGQQLTTEIEKLTSEVNANKMENHRLQVGSQNHGYSALPNKRTGTFIISKLKFLLVRSFLSGTLIN